MTTALWCVLIAAGLPLLSTFVAKAGGRMPLKANAHPREWLDRLEGWPKRANWAQLNAFEGFPPFAAGVIISQIVHAPQARIDQLAIAYIILRLVYLALYIANFSTLRSIVWFASVGCIVGLFASGA